MLNYQITVLIPTSPIPRHPDTGQIDACVDSVRRYFPRAQLIIMADGVRPQMEHRRAQYEEYVASVRSKAFAGEYGPNAVVKKFREHSQQAVMTRETLRDVDTPLILFCEHDVVFRPEGAIAFPAIFDLLLTGGANLVRFYNWADIWHEHAHLMRGEFGHQGSRFVRTVQYSQWPLVSTANYHRAILDRYFTPERRAMIETVMYGPVAASQWEDHKIVIYLNGGLVFEHRNGRMDEATGVRDPADW